MKKRSKKLLALLFAMSLTLTSVMPPSSVQASGTATPDAADAYVVVLDPGHGSNSLGYHTGTYREYEEFVIDETVINYKIAAYTKLALEEKYGNIEVYITKSNMDEDPAISARVAFAVEKNADLFVSQHINSTSEEITTASGVLAIVPQVDSTHEYNKEAALGAQLLGQKILERLSGLGFSNLGFKNRLSGDNTLYPDGSLADYYGIVRICRENNLPGIIVEHGFANNLEDATFLSEETNLQKIGEADALGIVDYMTDHLGYVPEAPSEENPGENPEVPPVEPEPELPNPFEDVVKGEYYYNAVLWAVDQGITAGMTENTFGVANTCTRAQGVSFLWRYEGKPSSDLIILPFQDIDTKAYYYNALRWALQYNITAGTSDIAFSPDAFLTRGQFVTFLWRTAGRPEPTSTENPFVDVTETDYFYDAVLWAVENGITAGVSEDRFAPEDSCLRVQVVTFLKRVADTEEADNKDATEGSDTSSVETDADETDILEPSDVEDETSAIDDSIELPAT